MQKILLCKLTKRGKNGLMGTELLMKHGMLRADENFLKLDKE